MKRFAILWPLPFLISLALGQQNDNPIDRIPSYFLEEGRRLAGDRITFCINEEGLLADFDRAVAHELAQVLLLEDTLVDIEAVRRTNELDYRLPLNQQELFIILTNECSAFMGFLLSTSGYADWLTITRPYLRTRFVLAVLEGADVGNLGNLPAGARVGTRMLSSADLNFTAFNGSLPPDRRWRRIPYPNNRLLLERLLDGSLDGILIWEPALHVGFGNDLEAAGVKVVPTTPFQGPVIDFGVVLKQRDIFLRQALDEAIAVLIEDGIATGLITELGIQGGIVEP